MNMEDKIFKIFCRQRKLSPGSIKIYHNALTKYTEFTGIWINLEIKKGEIVPMIVEKVNVDATSLSNAQSTLGTFNKSSNYWIRPLKPTDNTDSTDKQFEFYRAIAYWSAPYSKHAGEMHPTTPAKQ